MLDYIQRTEGSSASSLGATAMHTPIHKVRQEVYNRNLMEEFKSLGAKTTKQECKTKTGDAETINCVRAETLFGFLDNLEYSQKQKHACLDPYRVELVF